MPEETGEGTYNFERWTSESQKKVCEGIIGHTDIQTLWASARYDDYMTLFSEPK